MDKSSTSIDLIPDELIELILSKFDYKSMIRFKSVSKSWHSIISPPRLLRTLQSRLSENRNKFLIWDRKGNGNNNLRLHMIELVNGKSVKISELPYPYQDMRPLRSCNGLILLGKGHECMLWNPFIGKHIKIPSFAPETNRYGLFNCLRTGSEPVEHVFYYDPITDDHRIVLAYLRFYVVYSCKNGRWSEIKDLHFCCTPSSGHKCGDIIIHRLWVSKGNEEVSYFDTRDGQSHRIKVPDEVKNASFELAEISSKQSIHIPAEEEGGNLLHFWVMEDDARNFRRKQYWRKVLTAEKAAPYVAELRPVRLNSEGDDDVVLWAKKGSGKRGRCLFQNAENREKKLFISNLGENWSFKEIDFNWGSITNYLAYTENLYMPC